MHGGEPKVPLRDATLLGYLVDAAALQQPLQALVLELPRGADNVVSRRARRCQR
jgi:hypothetical protein